MLSIHLPAENGLDAILALQYYVHLKTMRQDDLIAFKTWFGAYCDSFSTSLQEDRKNFDLKRKHTTDVCANMLLIAQDLGLDDQQTMVAETIALFHDIGRFPQYREYKTFQDSISVNHAALGAKVLIENSTLRNLPQEEQNLIVRAVTLHNVLDIPGELDRDLLQLVKMIRDADKLDIWRVCLEYYSQPKSDQATAVGLGLPDAPEYSPEILTRLHQRKLVYLSTLKTLTDFKLLQLAWIFDLNFIASLRIVAQKQYIDRFAVTLPTTGDIADAVDSVREYVNERLKNS